jgi:hypothetical protein
MKQPKFAHHRFSIVVIAVLAVAFAVSCARYEQKPLPIRHPTAYENAVEAFGATLAARSYDDGAEAKEFFGFDIIGAGVLPVQIVFDHLGSDPIEIVAGQTFLIDSQGQLWNILEKDLAYRRIEEKTDWGEIAPSAGKGAFLGAAAGAIVGAAIGIVTGENVAVAAGKGAAVGGAGGAVIGGAKGADDPQTKKAIRDDLRSRSLENEPIPPQSLSHGVLFFPAEAIASKQLRLQLRNTQTGEVRILNLAL